MNRHEALGRAQDTVEKIAGGSSDFGSKSWLGSLDLQGDALVRRDLALGRASEALTTRAIPLLAGITDFRFGSRIELNRHIREGRLPEKTNFVRNVASLNSEGAASLNRVEPVDFSKEKQIMGKEFFGPDEVENAFGLKIDRSQIPEMPFSEQELAKAKNNGQFLMLYIDKDADGKPITMKSLNERLKDQFERNGKGKIFYDTSWYEGQDFFTSDVPRVAWRLITKDVIPGSTSKNYLQQTDAIADYIKKTVFPGDTVPVEWQDAIEEFKREKKDIDKIISTKWQEAAKKLSDLKLNQMARQSPIEDRYSWLVYFQNKNDRLLRGKYNWTNGQTSHGDLVNVGRSYADGAYVAYWRPESRDSVVGVCFSR